jgi:hypothetical protein
MFSCTFGALKLYGKVRTCISLYTRIVAYVLYCYRNIKRYVLLDVFCHCSMLHVYCVYVGKVHDMR